MDMRGGFQAIVPAILLLAFCSCGEALADPAQVAEQAREDASSARAAGDLAGEIGALARGAEAKAALGLLNRANADLTEALRITPGDDLHTRLRLLGQRGAIQTRLGDVDEARADLGEALILAIKAGDRRSEAVTLNNIGNFLLLERRYTEASRVYSDAAEIARDLGASALETAALLNHADVLLAVEAPEEARNLLNRAAPLMPAQPSTGTDISARIKLARQRMIGAERGSRDGARVNRVAAADLDAARKGARDLGNPRLESYATGYLGQIYEKARRLADARRATDAAERLAISANAPASLFLWQWQRGRLDLAEGDIAAAIGAHEEALATLSTLRGSLLSGFGTGRGIFEESVRPIIMGLADLQLRRAATADAETRQALLRDARGTVELLKAAEVEDYFNDDCLAALESRTTTIDALPEGAAALYPVVLPDRVELVLSIGDRLENVRVAIDAQGLGREVDAFTASVSEPGSAAWRRPAERLYGWLVRPIEPLLSAQDMETLIVVPTGALAAVPFAALHDGERFLIEQRAVAIAPGLSLVDPRPFSQESARALVGALSTATAGFPALRHVSEEVASIGRHFQSEVLNGGGFSEAQLAGKIERRPYRILHLATHAALETDVRESFLLTADGRINMAGLEALVRPTRFRDEPIELLTLSACTTARGDPRAALGLAGLGLKSGARSALASLWLVNDRSTATLMDRFYSRLAAPDTSKAEALRDAQRDLLAVPATAHPVHWAGFILVGNWL